MIGRIVNCFFHFSGVAPYPFGAAVLSSPLRMVIQSAHRKRHREPFPAPPNPTIYRNIAYVFVALTLIIVFVSLWLSSVRATVVITAMREPMLIEASVDVAREPREGQIPGRVVQGVFEKVQEFPVSAREGTAVDMPATGRVRITNGYSRDQPLVKVTRLLASDGALYRIDDTVVVPAGGSVEVGAYADKPGASFELEKAGVRFTIPGLAESLQTHIYAESVTPFTGGTRTVSVLTDADVAAATDELQKAIVMTAQKTLRAEAGDASFSESAYLVKVLETNTNIAVGEETDRFLLSLKLDVTGVFYPKEDLNALLQDRLSDRVPEGREVVDYAGAETEFSVGSVDVKSETASVNVAAYVDTKLGTNSPVIAKEVILGLPISEAEARLEDLEGIESVQITVRPSWVRRLPRLKDHITVKVE